MAASVRSKKLRPELIPVILSLAAPTMLEELVDTAVQYIDIAMVGSLGTAATAAVGSTATISWLVGGTFSAIGIGFLSYIAKSRGSGDNERASRAAAQAVFVALFTGILFSALVLPLSGYVPGWMHADVSIRPLAARYFLILYSTMVFRSARIIFGTLLRASGDTRTPMRIGLLVNLLNVAGNFFLIYPARELPALGGMHIPGAGLGVEGAAIASAASVAVGGILITIALWRHSSVSPRGRSLMPDPEILRPCLKVSLPNMLQRFCTSLGYVVFASMINSLGELSTAAHTIANTVESAFYIPGYGMMAAAATLTGNCIGAGDRQRQRDLAGMILIIEISLMILTGGLLLIFAPAMMSMFSRDAAVILLGSTVLRMVAVSEPFYGVSIVTEGMLQGAGLTFRPFLFNIIGMWGVRILGTALCIRFGCGLVSAWCCMIAHNMLLLILLRIYYRKVFSGVQGPFPA
ncbi:MAG: MATE family efflux transporter [Oscillospiraceae bacterium]|nr:MATE family efflux transporter [Oscillospiraceae bacterium]